MSQPAPAEPVKQPLEAKPEQAKSIRVKAKRRRKAKSPKPDNVGLWVD